MLKHKHSPASKVSHCYSWVISSCISTSWLTHFKGELQCQMLFIQIQFVSSLRKPVFYSCRSIFMFFFVSVYYCCGKLQRKQEKNNNNNTDQAFNRVIYVCVFLEMCSYMFLCFCLCYIWMWVLTVHESGVSVNKTITVLPVCPRCHFTLA